MGIKSGEVKMENIQEVIKKTKVKIENQKEPSKDRLKHISGRYTGKGAFNRHIEDQIRWGSEMGVPLERKIYDWANNRRPSLIQDDLWYLIELENSRWNRFELKFGKNRPGDFGANFRLSFSGIYVFYRKCERLYLGTAFNLRQRFIEHIFPRMPMDETPLYKLVKGNFEGITIVVKRMDKEFKRLTWEARMIHKKKPFANTHYKKRES